MKAIERLDTPAAESPLAGYPGRSTAEELQVTVYSSAHEDLTQTLAEHGAGRHEDAAGYVGN